jgi:UrcA family protein
LSLFAVGAHAGESLDGESLAGESLAGESSAGESPQVIVRQKVVRYADLDLSKQSDAAELYARLRRASNRVCGHEDNRNLAMQRAHESCSSEALADAVERVNASALTALHAADGRIRVAQRRADGGPRT